MNIFRILLWPLRNRRQPPAAAEQLSPLQVETVAATASIRYNDIEVVYATPNYATRWRAETFFDKEPDTLEWIAGFKPQEVLVDVGANVGMYTIWAAMTRAVRVFAFEPESQNYALLYQNIVRNNLSRQVTGYCVALSDESGYSSLYLSEFVAGSSVHTYGAEHDFKLQPRTSALSQGCVATTLDQLVATGVVPMPDHIKIDVDGIEHKVLAGSRNVLADRRLRSVLVEINTNLEQHRQIIADMKEFGFDYSEQQVAQARRTEGAFKGVGNYVFFR